jgi:hypothetical protein
MVDLCYCLLLLNSTLHGKPGKKMHKKFNGPRLILCRAGKVAPLKAAAGVILPGCTVLQICCYNARIIPEKSL